MRLRVELFNEHLWLTFVIIERKKDKERQRERERHGFESNASAWLRGKEQSNNRRMKFILRQFFYIFHSKT